MRSSEPVWAQDGLVNGIDYNFGITFKENRFASLISNNGQWRPLVKAALASAWAGEDAKIFSVNLLLGTQMMTSSDRFGGTWILWIGLAVWEWIFLERE